ncbi:hypothetical protein SEA_ALEEMILY_95 [Gordonia phage Aleemily]|uniref:Uncharacterized protein n=1 Tax=Gordonia phage Aleemily TaxID=2965181 RepID=A0A9E7QDL2_9CAUD|nr:hypothetical protein SEA_ALEEMILY_95 [Gordonia phage Aleemily]
MADEDGCTCEGHDHENDMILSGVHISRRMPADGSPDYVVMEATDASTLEIAGLLVVALVRGLIADFLDDGADDEPEGEGQ